jgi:hypothetical protein
MRRLVLGAALLLAPKLMAQSAGKFPPDSLVNLRVIPRDIAVLDVIGMMRNYTSWLGVRCQYCHVGEEGMPLAQFNFPSDDKRTKLVARQMMRMVGEINQRLDTLPGRAPNGLHVTCGTCHRGVSRPVPLETFMQETAATAGADSAIRAYRALRERYYGSDAYNFSEPALSIAAFRLGRAGKFAEAFALLGLNEQLYPGSSGMYVFRGNLTLMQGDTTGAERAFREAIRLNPGNEEAKGRLRAIGRQP